MVAMKKVWGGWDSDHGEDVRMREEVRSGFDEFKILN